MSALDRSLKDGHKGRFRCLQVAVKRTRRPEASSEAINFFREIECLAAVKHPNVLPFIGACLADAEHCFLVTEFMPGGTLKEWLYGAPGARRPRHTLAERVRMASQVRPASHAINLEQQRGHKLDRCIMVWRGARCGAVNVAWHILRSDLSACCDVCRRWHRAWRRSKP